MFAPAHRFHGTHAAKDSKAWQQGLCRWLARGFGLFAILLAASAVYCDATFDTATGTVTRAHFEKVTRSGKSGPRTEYLLHLGYTFETRDGTPVEGSEIISNAGHIAMSEGQQIEVRYRSPNPDSNMSADGLAEIYRFAAIFGGMAVFCYFLGFILKKE